MLRHTFRVSRHIGLPHSSRSDAGWSEGDVAVVVISTAKVDGEPEKKTSCVCENLCLWNTDAPAPPPPPPPRHRVPDRTVLVQTRVEVKGDVAVVVISTAEIDGEPRVNQHVWQCIYEIDFG